MDKSIICVVDYNLDWPLVYAQEAGFVSMAAGDSFIHIHHIGSTAIPGIMAKPVIDMLLEVSAVEALDDQSAKFEMIGYEVMGEFGIPGRRYYRKSSSNGVRTHQIHAFKTGVSDVTRHLVFRDYMRLHPAIATCYGELKSQLANECSPDMEAYMDGKNSFIKKYERVALEWMTEKS